MKKNNVESTLGHHIVFKCKDGTEVLAKIITYKLSSGKEITTGPVVMLETAEIDDEEYEELLEAIVAHWTKMVASITKGKKIE